MKTRLQIRHAAMALTGLLLAGLLLASPAVGASPNALGWVGNLWPASGSTTTITAGDSLTVYVQVWKDGVTNAPGQGADITCTLHWGQVDAFGGAWYNITDTPMTYNTDIGNNDEYMATIAPGPGLYEFTAFCTDLTDNSVTWSDNPSGNGKLEVQSPGPACDAAALGDDAVVSAGLFHNTFAAEYRAPGGAVTNAQGTVTLRFRTCANDVSNASIRVWDDRLNTETISALSYQGDDTDPLVGDVSFWAIDLPIPTDPTILYYVFIAQDGAATRYYRDDDPKFYGGGTGVPESDQGTAYWNSFQITVYDENFDVPQWMRRGIVYQVFPDRFRDGNSANNPKAGRFYYNELGGTIVRSNTTTWNTPLCDPRGIVSPACPGKYGQNFYGGDLIGLTQKINDGYFSNLGVTVIYLNPIFYSPSNHKYDTADYSKIDQDFGGKSAWLNLAAAASAKNIRLVLDGVFNHTSSDSAYFDLFKRFNYADNMVSPLGPGNDDNIGACESPNSVRRPWYFIPDIGTPAGGVTERCDPTDADDPGGAWTLTYEAWFGYGSLPKLNSANPGVRGLFYSSGATSVGPYWVAEGADGWRLDVGGDVDPGLTNDPANDFWEGFRTAIRDTSLQTRTVPIMIGEEWGDASPWLLGNEWDSAMNYRFRSAVLSWLFEGCSGNGCTGGVKFEDNDSNDASASGAISAITPSQLDARLRAIQEDYPPQAFKAMMNLAGSHDTNRLRFLLKKINNDDDAAALQRMRELWLLTYTYAGAPTLYYGDEMGLSQDGVWDGTTWQDDPYNRAPFPWDDTPGAFTANTDLHAFARKLASIRLAVRALQEGDVFHGLYINDAERTYGFVRWFNYNTVLVALNRDTVTHTVTFTNMEQDPFYLFGGLPFVEVLSKQVYIVDEDPDTFVASLTVDVPPNSGVILLEPGTVDTPKPPTLLIGLDGPDVGLRWNPVYSDTNFGAELPLYHEVWRSSTDPYFMPGDASAVLLKGDAVPAVFGADGGRITYLDEDAVGKPDEPYFYIVRAVNGAASVTDDYGERGYSAPSNRKGKFEFALVPGSEE